MTTDTLAETGDAATSRPSFLPVSSMVGRYLLVSFVFLDLALAGGVVVALELVFPDLFGGVAVLSFGRLQPAATHLFVYGWLTVGLAGALIHISGRAAPDDSVPVAPAAGALVLLGGGYAAGAAGILLGSSEGRRLLEAPLWADAAVLLGLIGLARLVTTRARAAAETGPVEWYAVAAAWWLVLLHVVGNIPGLGGMTSVLQTSFYRAGFTGLWVVAAGVGVVYYLIPRLAGREALAPTQMSVIGLWSLAFVWALTAPADITYGPTPDWLDTLSVLFAIGMLIPAGVIASDVATGMRGRWHRVEGSVAMRLVMAGLAAFVALPVANLLLAVRSSSAVVGFTDWVGGYEFLAFGGAGTFWLLAFAVTAFAGSGEGGSTAARAQYRGVMLGALVFVGALLFSGVQTGLTWLGGANSEALTNTGEGFRNTVEALSGAYVVRLVAYVIYAVALLWLVVGLLARRRGTPTGNEELEPEEPGIAPELALARPVGLARLLTTTVVLFAMAVALVWVLPALDGGEATLLADRSRNYDEGGAVATGREAYLREGCYVCHTQAVRPIVTDVGLGAVSLGGDYVHETPALVGHQRVGPDLMHVWTRTTEEEGAGAADFLAAHLQDPRRARPWSTMPAYDHLSDSDVDALVTYIASLD